MSNTGGFNSMVQQLRHAPAQAPVVRQSDFKKFQKQFTFTGLLGKKYGAALCEHFDIIDNLIMFGQMCPTQINDYFTKQYVRL